MVIRLVADLTPIGARGMIRPSNLTIDAMR